MDIIMIIKLKASNIIYEIHVKYIKYIYIML